MSVIVCTYVSYQSINVLSCGFYTLSFCSPLRFSPKNLRNLSGFIKLSLSIPSRSKSINDRTATISASRHTTLFIIWATPSKTLSLSFCFLNIINYSKERWHNIILSVKRDEMISNDKMNRNLGRRLNITMYLIRVSLSFPVVGLNN